MTCNDINETMLQQLDPQVAIEIIKANQRAEIVGYIVVFGIMVLFFWFMYKAIDYI